MKKFLLFAAVAAAMCSAQAENKLYYNTDYRADPRAVSESGTYAVFSDPDNCTGYVWNIENPSEFKPIIDTEKLGNITFEAYGVNDEGTIVGSVEITTPEHRLYWHPAVFKDGEITYLPCNIDQLGDDGTAMTGNLNYAISISNNGKIIGGYLSSRPGVESTARPSYPCLWELKDNGEWELHLYNHNELPNHQGFWTRTMMSDGTLEGTVLGGILNCGAGSMVPAIVRGSDGNIEFWNTLEQRILPVETKWGTKYWQFDFIDGFCDGWQTDYFFQGGFYGCDARGNFYGYKTRSVVPEDGIIPEDGHIKIEMGACTYNVNTGDSNHIIGESAYLTGTINDVIYLADGKMLINGAKESPLDYFDIKDQAQGITFAGVSYTSKDGRVLAAQHNVFNEARMENDPFPVMIVLDDAPVSGIEDVVADKAAPVIRGLKGAIEVQGAASVAVYDIQGRYMGNGAYHAPGLYIVKADDTTAKVIVK